MGIYVLIILCLYTLIGVLSIIYASIETDPDKGLTNFIVGIFMLITGILAIVFQSINL